MIEIKKLKKQFRDIVAIDHLTLSMKENEIFGLVGTNGAGKTTLLRIMSGVIRQDEGEVLIDGSPVWDNAGTKSLFYFIPDAPFFFRNGTARMLVEYHRNLYEHFDEERFHRLMSEFGLDENRQTDGFSKGMRKQLAILLGICANTRYLFCDETFDGLDPVMRQAAKSLFAKDMADRGLGVVMSSHNLRELEDVCDHVGLLHRGGVLLSRDLAEMKLNTQKVQVVFPSEEERGAFEAGLTVVEHRSQGRMHVYIVRHTAEEISEILSSVDTVFYDMLPLSLEEIFISETEVVGYDIQSIIKG